jgi:tRNA G10  N-methylase Trm11
MIYTACTTGTNAQLIANVACLYLKDGMVIADVTYGRGNFWQKIDLTKYDFHASDQATCPEAPYDFRHLPYDDNTFDVLVLDPPYISHTHGNKFISQDTYNNFSTAGMDHGDIIQMYSDGLKEAFRVVKPKGLVWVKCQDEMSDKQRWSHIEILNLAETMRFKAEDLFIYVQSGKMPIRGKQIHARKNHSYLWVFKKLVIKS